MTGVPSVDPARPTTAIKRAMTAIALSKPGTWFYTEVASVIDPWLIRISRGRVDTAFGVIPIVLLSTTGARSGRTRTVPLVYFTDGPDVILMASSFGRAKYPAWYHNAQANPDVSLARGGESVPYRAEEVHGAERNRLFALATQLYRGYGVYEERTAGIREVPVLRLSPLG